MEHKQTLLISIGDPAALDTARACLRTGKLIVFPTDTLYGLACDPRNPAALQSLYEAKGRSALKAIPVLIGAQDQLELVAAVVSDPIRCLMARFWPGALTLILPKKADLPMELTPYPGLAVRMPDHPFALWLLQAFGPLAVTSANLSGHENPTTAAEVIEQLDGQVDLILDGSTVTGGQASTIIDCAGTAPILLRQGPIPFDSILKVWNQA